MADPKASDEPGRQEAQEEEEEEEGGGETELVGVRHNMEQFQGGDHSGSAAEKKGGDEKVLLISLVVSDDSGSHALYAINLPPTRGGEATPPPLRLPEEEDKTIYPILEVPWDQCSPTRCCAKLRSRLYYLGGPRDDLFCCTPEVHYVDIVDQEALLSPEQQQLVLKQGIPMNEGKMGCYAFVFDDKMYAIGTHSFEVFDPDSEQWSSLPPPRLNYHSYVQGHAVVDGGDKFVFTTLTADRPYFYYFDLGKSKWGRVYPQIKSHVHPRYGPALNVGDRLYFPDDCKNTIFSSGPSHPSRLARLFETPCSASGELSKLLESELTYEPHLTYLGNNTFVCVMGIGLPHPEYPHTRRHSCTDPDKGVLRVVVFEVTDEKHFQTKVLHTSQYVCTSKTGVSFSGYEVDGCFSA